MNILNSVSPFTVCTGNVGNRRATCCRISIRHGKTIGELAVQFRNECFPTCALSVLPMKNWDRAMWFDQTGLPWVMPSPNMPTLTAATVYAGRCLLEGTNVSEG